METEIEAEELNYPALLLTCSVRRRGDYDNILARVFWHWVYVESE